MMEHHALLLSDPNPLVCDITEHGFSVSFECRMPQFGIHDVRTLIQTAHRRPNEIDSERQTLLIATEFITEEAQHALLKLIEEPPLSTTFIFLIPEGYRFLPTLESRFMRQTIEKKMDEIATVFRDFKAGSVGKRIESIEVALKAKDTAWQFEIKKGLAALLLQPKQSYEASTLTQLAFIQRTLLTRGASNKFLLEYLALIL